MANGKRSRAEWFALFAVCGELGAVIGPVAGGVLSGIGFRHIALAGAGIFLLALAVLFLPARRRADDNNAQTSPVVDPFAPAALCRVYSRLQLMAVELQPTVSRLPVEIQRSGGREQDLAPLFMLASLLIITLQLLSPASPGELAPCASCRWAFCCCRLPFASVALFAAAPPAEGWLRYPGGWFCAAHPRPDAVSARSQGSDPAVRRGVDAGRPLRSARHRRRVRGVEAGNLLLGHLLDQALTPRRRRFIPGFCWRCFRCAAPSPCGQSVARWRQHDAERATARSGREPTIKYTAWGR